MGGRANQTKQPSEREEGIDECSRQRVNCVRKGNKRDEEEEGKKVGLRKQKVSKQTRKKRENRRVK